MFLTIKEVSAWLNIKSSTLYLWVAQGKIPYRKIHGLIRFERDTVIAWLQSFDAKERGPVSVCSRSSFDEVDQLIEAATRAVYTSRHGETITPSPHGKENENGAR